MNYTKEQLATNFLLRSWDGKPKEVLCWNDDTRYQPDRYKLVGVRPGEKRPWIVEVYYQDGTDTAYFQHAANIPADWTKYVEPKEIPLFECEYGKCYRVTGICGMEFDRIMFCVKANPTEGYMFADSIDSEKRLSDHWINHVYTC